MLNPLALCVKRLNVNQGVQLLVESKFGQVLLQLGQVRRETKADDQAILENLAQDFVQRVRFVQGMKVYHECVCWGRDLEYRRSFVFL